MKSLRLAMVMANHEAMVVLVNSPAERLFGYERQELLGQPVEILVPESSRKSHPGFRWDFFVQPRSARRSSIG